MYDDLLGKRNKKEEKPIVKKGGSGFKWDFAKYQNEAYCGRCGSTNLTTLNDVLKNNKLVKTIECNTCFCKWNEIWNKDIDLELESLNFLTQEQ